MTNIIEAIVFIVMGTVVTLTSIFTQAGGVLIGLGAAITVMAIVALVINVIDKKKNNKEKIEE